LHISNRHLYFERVVASLAVDAELGGRLLQRDDSLAIQGVVPSTWAVLARTQADLDGLAKSPRWQKTRLDPFPTVNAWTDDFHDLVSVFKW
jgi:hypothetical protein